LQNNALKLFARLLTLSEFYIEKNRIFAVP
jgi:hypothetical protein